MKTFRIFVALFIVLLLENCAPSQTTITPSPISHAGNDQLIESASQTPSLNSLENPIPLDNTPDFSGMTPPPSDTDQFADLAKQDLADRLKITVGQINLLKTTEITWPDISQGCDPNSGQPLLKGRTTTGYRIWLEANGMEYAYHIGLDGRIVFCEN